MRVHFSRTPLASVLVLAGAAVSLRAQCPDGTPPPCRNAPQIRAVWDSARASAEAAGARRRIAVLYFEDQTPGRQHSTLADGITEQLIVALQSGQGLNVISKGGSTAIRGLSIPPDSIARALRVGTLVTGVVVAEGDSLRVTVRMLDDAGIEMDRVTFKKPAKDVVALSENLTEQVAGLIRRRVGEAVRFARVRVGTRSSEAWLRYQRAVQTRDRGDSLYSARAAGAWLSAYHEADSLAAVAELLDPKWSDPALLRGALDYRRSRRAGPDTALLRRMLDSAVGHVQRALALNPSNLRGIELRGETKYWRWLMNIDSDTTKRRRLLRDAHADLELVVRREPSIASAYATLSHMYNNVQGKSLADVRIAASKALEADAFLENADVIIGRLALAAHDDGAFAEADRWCGEGKRRYPNNPRFVRCRLYVMSMPEAKPDPTLAWVLADSLVGLTPAAEQRTVREFARVLVAAVFARAAMNDSARAILIATNPSIASPTTGTFYFNAAYVWTIIGDYDAAIDNLRAYLAINPELPGASLSTSWWFRDLTRDARFHALFSKPPGR